MHTRRQVHTSAASAALVYALPIATLPIPTLAQASLPEDGANYLSLERPVRQGATPGKIDVIEFFRYGCPFCHRFEPELEQWLAKLPKDVAFRGVPIAPHPDFVPQQRLYYALESMKLVEKLHHKVLSAIHQQRVALDKPEQMAAWLATQGVDKAEFLKNLDSFSTQTKTSQATQLQAAYGVRGVPSLGVAGKFYTDGAFNPTMAQALRVVDFLVARERATMNRSPAKKGT